MTTALYHGGIPGLRPGDLIEPGHRRAALDGCPWCEARAQGDAYHGIDGPSQHQDGVYLTPIRLYAKHYASLYGRGDLYRVEPIGELVASTEDTMPTVIAPAARVLSVYERAVLLTDTERRRLWREWSAADAAAGQGRLLDLDTPEVHTNGA